MSDDGFTNNGRWAILVGVEDVPHISPEERARLANSYAPHEREARLKGIPSLGSGAIYPIPESDFVCKPFEIPDWHRRVFALDVGWRRTAALWVNYDQDSDTAYAYSEHYRGEAEPAVHAQAVKGRGTWIPGVIDPAARGRTQTDGTQLIQIYRELGLQLTPADNAVEAGIYAVWSRLSAGKLKIFSTLENLLQEIRIYRRDEKGKIVKENDHLCDCLRYACLSGLSIATAKPRTQWGAQKTLHQIQYDPTLEMWRKPGQR